MSKNEEYASFEGEVYYKPYAFDSIMVTRNKRERLHWWCKERGLGLVVIKALPLTPISNPKSFGTLQVLDVCYMLNEGDFIVHNLVGTRIFSQEDWKQNFEVKQSTGKYNR